MGDQAIRDADDMANFPITESCPAFLPRMREKAFAALQLG